MTAKKQDFVSLMVSQYRPQHVPSDVVAEFKKYYKNLYDVDIKKGVHRKLSYLSSAQSNLSKYKKQLRLKGVKDDKWLAALKLSKEEGLQLAKEKKTSVHDQAIDLPVLHADNIIIDCRQLLADANPFAQIIAVAALTGRREAEILYAITFSDPKEDHYTSNRYWACATGFLKQRENDPQAVQCREVPLLADRASINKAILEIRQKCPVGSVAEVNRKYGKQISRALLKFCPELKKLHEFRKFYAAVCYQYFNERKCSLPRIAADYLGHKTMSETVLTYLSARIEGTGTLSFGHGKLNGVKKNSSHGKKSTASLKRKKT